MSHYICEPCGVTIYDVSQMQDEIEQLRSQLAEAREKLVEAEKPLFLAQKLADWLENSGERRPCLRDDLGDLLTFLEKQQPSEGQ